MQKSIFRATALTLLMTTAGFAFAASGALPVEKLSADVVVVGAGGTGVAAAASAAQHGAKVIVFEKMPFIGGSSALAGGAIAAGDTKPQARAGEKETTSEGFMKIWLNDQKRSYRGGSKAYPDEALVKSMTFAFTDTINWLEEVVGHTFAKPRPFGYGGPDYAHAPAESPVPASGRGSSPAGGRFVIKNVKLYLDKMGVPVRTATPVTDLIQNEKGEVVGVKAADKKAVYEVSAKAVVLATGGFAHNKEMMERLVPVYAPFTDKSVATVGATGDGIRMAVKAGGVEYEDAWVIGLYVSGAKPEYSKTFTSKDKYKDRVFVNEKGERFVNEDLPYLTDPVAMQKAVWAIVDSQDPKKVEVLNGVQDPREGQFLEGIGRRVGRPGRSLGKDHDGLQPRLRNGRRQDLRQAQGVPQALQQSALLRRPRHSADGRHHGRRQGGRSLPRDRQGGQTHQGSVCGRRSHQPSVLQPRLHLGHGARHRLHLGSSCGRVRREGSARKVT